MNPSLVPRVGGALRVDELHHGEQGEGEQSLAAARSMLWLGWGGDIWSWVFIVMCSLWILRSSTLIHPTMFLVCDNPSHVLKVCADHGISTEHEDISEHCDASKFIFTAVECLAKVLIGYCQLRRARDGCHHFISFQSMTSENLLWSILQLQELEKINVKMKSRLVVCFCATD